MDALADALVSNEISLHSPAAAIQTTLGIPAGRLRAFMDVLRSSDDQKEVVLALRASSAAGAMLGARTAHIEVAWTFPGDTRGGIRTTGGVARDIIENAQASLLIVGYSVTVDPKRSGLAAQTIASIAAAARRGIQVTAVLHRNVDRMKLMQAWAAGVKPPTFFTWPEQGDEMAAIHAKVLVADRIDVLVSSANLTYHGYEANLEMGLRVRGGSSPGVVHDKFFELISSRVLHPWPWSVDPT